MEWDIHLESLELTKKKGEPHFQVIVILTFLSSTHFLALVGKSILESSVDKSGLYILVVTDSMYGNWGLQTD